MMISRRARWRAAIVGSAAIATYWFKPKADAYTDFWTAKTSGCLIAVNKKRSEKILKSLDRLTVAGLIGSYIAANTSRHRTLWFAGPAFFTVTRFVGAKGLPGRWSYDTFLEPLIWLSYWDLSGKGANKEIVGAASRAILYGVYSQAGISKIIHGYGAWIHRGDALHTFLAHLAKPQFKPAHNSDPTALSRMICRSVPAFEIIALPVGLVVSPAMRLPLNLASGLFHVLVLRYLGISFWPLLACTVALAEYTGRSDLETILDALRTRFESEN